MSTFNSRQQYNKITQLFSKLFDVKLNKVRHKISIEEGFKNSNSLLSSLPEANTIEDSSIEITLDVDSLNDEYLNEIISFEVYKNNTKNELVILQVEAPRAIKFIFDGFVFKSNEWLTKTIYLEVDFLVERYDDEKLTDVQTINMDFNSLKWHDYKCSLALVQQLLNHKILYTDTTFLLDNINGITLELISGGTLKQYNSICKNEIIINSLKSINKIEALGFRYFFQLGLFSNYYDMELSDPEFIHVFIMNDCSFINKYNSISATNELINFELPPMESLTKSVEEFTRERNITTELLEGYFPIIGSNIIDSPFKHLLNSLYENINEPNYVPSIEEYAFIKHANFAFKYLCKSILSKTDGKYSFEDLCSCLTYLKYLDLDFPEFQQIMLLTVSSSERFKEMSQGYSFVIPETSVATLVTIKTLISLINDDNNDKNKLDSLFKSLEDNVLNSKVNMTENYSENFFKEEISSLAKTKTIKELLSTSLLLTK
jgi:hypothetical protein